MRASRSKFSGKRLVTIAIASVAMCASLVPAYAGPLFDFFAKPLETYYGSGANNQPKVPDFKFSRDDFFKNFDVPAVLHLKLDAGYAFFKGYTIHYTPATDTVLVWRMEGTNSEATSAKQYGPDDGCFGTYGTVEFIGGVKTCIPGSSLGAASTSTYRVLAGTIPGTTRSCTWDPGSDGKDTHSC